MSTDPRLSPVELTANVRAALRFVPLHWALLGIGPTPAFEAYDFRLLNLMQLCLSPMSDDARFPLGQKLGQELEHMGRTMPHHDVLRIHGECVAASHYAADAFAKARVLEARERAGDYTASPDSHAWVNAAYDVIARAESQGEQLWIEAAEACRMAREDTPDIRLPDRWPAILRELFVQEWSTDQDLGSAQLWPESTDFERLWQEVRADWAARGPAWTFWIDWYEGVLAGRSPDWELLKEIALLPDDLWATGDKAVGKRIDAIRDKQRMRRVIAEIRSSASAFAAGGAPPELRGHNNPPELIADGLVEARQGAAEFVPLLATAEVELAKPVPIASTLEQIAKDIARLAAKLGRYALKLLDSMLVSAAQKAGTPLLVGIAWVATDPNSLLALAKALKAIAAQWLGL